LFQQPIRLHKTGGKFRSLKIVREWKTGLRDGEAGRRGARWHSHFHFRLSDFLALS